MASADRKFNFLACSICKSIFFARGKNLIQIAVNAEVAESLCKGLRRFELTDLDVLIQQQAQFGEDVTSKLK